MANHRAKGAEYMRELAARGGKASGVARKQKKVAKILGILEIPAELAKRPSYSGGWHGYDWRCPQCRHRNSIKRRRCAECDAFALANGRITREARRMWAEEHRVEAILRKHGLY